ncbi:MAG: sulfurtransferase [Rhodospirillaceae bacterium]|nr:MAG: sulfurtransferase [Rhodospirillaceae bacterium]
MSVDRIVFAMAGIFIWGGLGIWYMTQEPLWLIVPAFVGANMFQAAFTGFCPMAMILKKFGAKPGQAFD